MSKATRPIPTRPNLERDRKEAKVLVRDFRSADLRCLERIRSSHPAFRKSSPEAVRRSRFALRDAQLVLAQGADMRAPDSQGVTPVDHLAEEGLEEVAALLKEAQRSKHE